MSPEEKIACARVVVSVILADAEINDQEHAFLDEVFDELELSPAQRKLATSNVNVGDGPGDALSSLVSQEAKKMAVRLANSAMIIDGEAVPSEKQIVADIAARLQVDLTELDQEATRRVNSLRDT